MIPPYVRKVHRQKKPEVEQVLDRKLYVIVDNKHRPITHMDGHLMIFHRMIDAEDWLDKVAESADTRDIIWRVEKLSVYITKE